MANNTSNSSHKISLQKALEMTGRYRKAKTNVLNGAFAGKHLLPDSESFDRAAFDRLLAQEGCAGIRLYYAMDEQMVIRTIAVGIDASGGDIVPASVPATTTESTLSLMASATTTEEGSTETGEIVEEGQLCPPCNYPSSPLNPA